jgi:hypothetical protein
VIELSIVPLFKQKAGHVKKPRSSSRRRAWLLAGLVIVLGAGNVHKIANNHAPGCTFYRPVLGKSLIAHAAGGLPDRMYPNSIEALNRSYAHGLRIFEMDFHELPFGLMRAGHDPIDVLDPREAWISQVLDWLRHHPSTRLLVDMKTDNLSGLTLVAAAAPDLRSRITPFVYTKTQYAAVRALGLSLPVYALFHHQDPDWLTFANSHSFAAVALSSDRVSDIPKVHHPVILYTLDVTANTRGATEIITNCLIPYRTITE